jgi:hypothetical protein
MIDVAALDAALPDLVPQQVKIEESFVASSIVPISDAAPVVEGTVLKGDGPGVLLNTPDIFSVSDEDLGVITMPDRSTPGGAGIPTDVAPSILDDDLQATNGDENLVVDDSVPILRVSVSSNGAEANDGSPNHFNNASSPSLSADGRFAIFVSSAQNLVPNDTNGVNDVFVFDTHTKAIQRVSVSESGNQQNGFSGFGASDPAVSGDGRFVTFESVATNLVGVDANGFTPDIYVRDRELGTTERVSISSTGVQANSWSYNPQISEDGRLIAYRSNADNLVVNDNNTVDDIFVFDQNTGITERVSVGTDGIEANGDSFVEGISANGRHIVFWSHASNLVDGDINNSADIFIHDRETGLTVSPTVDPWVATAGYSQKASISGDGRYVAFASNAENLVGFAKTGSQVFLFDQQTGAIKLVSISVFGEHASKFSSDPQISRDGRFVSYHSLADDLVDDDSNSAMDVFLFDRQLETTTRLSVPASGGEGDGSIFYNAHLSAISLDGTNVAFVSDASNLIAGDTNQTFDIFVVENIPASIGPDTHEGKELSVFIDDEFSSLMDYREFAETNVDAAAAHQDSSAVSVELIGSIDSGLGLSPFTLV